MCVCDDQVERRYQSRLQDVKDRLEQSDSTNRSLQNYVQFLKASYSNVFGDSALSSSLRAPSPIWRHTPPPPSPNIRLTTHPNLWTVKSLHLCERHTHTDGRSHVHTQRYHSEYTDLYIHIPKQKVFRFTLMLNRRIWNIPLFHLLVSLNTLNYFWGFKETNADNYLWNKVQLWGLAKLTTAISKS